MEGAALAALINGLLDLVTRLIVNYQTRPDASPQEIEAMHKRLDETAALVASKKPVPPLTPEPTG